MIKPIPEDVLDALDEVEYCIGREEAMLIMGWLGAMLERGENITIAGTETGVAVVPYPCHDDDPAYGFGDSPADALYDALSNHEKWKKEKAERDRLALENWERVKDLRGD